MKMRVTPQKIGLYYDTCKIEFLAEHTTDYYPAGFAHIDTFWRGQKADRTIYDHILKGGVLEVEIDLDDKSIIVEQEKP